MGWEPSAVDNETWKSRFEEGAAALGLEVSREASSGLLTYSEELLRWNLKINLTAITDPAEVLEKHLLDSLALIRALGGVSRLLDLGAGAGFPGIPVALAVPGLEVTLVDSVAKKVGFMKHAIAHLELAPRVKAVHVNLGGHPESERVPKTEAVVSRAFMDVAKFLGFVIPYLADGGRAFAMTSHVQADDALGRGFESGWVLEERWNFMLPFSGAARSVLALRRS